MKGEKVNKAENWPSNPNDYQWKGTLSAHMGEWRCLAHCKPLKTDVIIDIKQFQKDTDNDADDLIQFSERLAQLIHITHPRLLTPVHSFHFKNEVWTILPRHSGGFLSQLLSSHYPNGINDVSLIAYLLFNVVDGLAYLHKNQKCHRNINPHSIYFDKDIGVAMLSRFDELKSIRFTKQRDQTNSLISSNREPWTDPLLLIKHPSASWYDGDIFSIGITALHLVFGVPPTYDEKFANKLVKIAVNPEADKSDLYKEIGIQAFKNKQCPIKEKLFEQLVNDCTAKASKRIKINLLKTHKFFKKFNIYDQETVIKKIGHLFASTECRISNLLPPTSFPNVDIPEEMLKIEESAKMEEKEEAKIEKKSEEKKNGDAENDSDWNFSTQLSTKIDKATMQTEESTDDLSELTGKQKRKVTSLKGRFLVEEQTQDDGTPQSSASAHVNPNTWNAEECATWVGQLGVAYQRYQQVFVDNGIDGEMMMQMNDDMLQEIIPSKLHRTKVISAAKKLFNDYV